MRINSAVRKLFLSILVLSVYVDNTAQNVKPYMWVPKKIGANRNTYYVDNKLQDLRDKLNQPDLTNEVVLGNFLGFFNYLEATYKTMKYFRVYIGVAIGDSAPDGFQNKWIFIFSPVNPENKDLDYFILPTKFDPADVKRISPDIKKVWTEYYEDNMPLGMIDLTNGDNENPGNRPGRPKYTDTRCATYCVKDLQDLIKTIKYFKDKDVKIGNDVKGALASYGKRGKMQKDGKRHYRKRTVIQFTLTNEITGENFFLDDIKEFRKDWLKSTGTKCPEMEIDNKGVVDNGQLCPFNCPN